MKRLVIAVVIFLIMIAFSGFTLYHLHNTHLLLLDKLEELSLAVEEGNQQKSVALSQEFSDLWLEKEELLIRYIRHAHIDNITTIAARLPAMAQYSDTSLLMGYILQLKNDIYHLWISELPSLENLL